MTRRQDLDSAFNAMREWCVSPEHLVGRRRPDQHWVHQFIASRAALTANDVEEFARSYDIYRFQAWDYRALAKTINKAGMRSPVSAVQAVTDLEGDLVACNKHRKKQLSAASKFSFFLYPNLPILIIDQWAEKAVTQRRKLARIKYSGSRYQKFWSAAQDFLKSELRQEDFCRSRSQFEKWLRQTGGPMANRTVVGAEFVTRRFFDKLLFFEAPRKARA